MIDETMTDEKAKKILDFLCKKHCDEKVVDCEIVFDCIGYPIVYWSLIDGTHMSSFVHWQSDFSLEYEMMIFSLKDHYEKFLKLLLNVSGDGREVIIIVPYDGSIKKEVFIPAFTNLEALMIEYDLENSR